MAKVKQQKDINQVAKSMVDFIEKKYSGTAVSEDKNVLVQPKTKSTVQKKIARFK